MSIIECSLIYLVGQLTVSQNGALDTDFPLEHRPTAKYDKTSTQFDAYTRSPKPRIKTQCTI